MKNVLADGIVQQTADCVGVGWLQNFHFPNFAKFLISCFANFYISRNFAKFKISCFAKFFQCCFAATLCWSGGGGGGEWGVEGGLRVLTCAPSALTQIVPISASIYTDFHSVIFNSVL